MLASYAISNLCVFWHANGSYIDKTKCCFKHLDLYMCQSAQMGVYMKRIISAMLRMMILVQVLFSMELLQVKGDEIDMEEVTIIYHVTDNSKAPYICIANKAEHMWIGDTFRFTVVANKLPQASIVWSISDNKVAEINRLTGEVRLKKPGTVKVYAKDLITGKSSACAVEVLDENTLELPEIPREWYEIETVTLDDLPNYDSYYYPGYKDIFVLEEDEIYVRMIFKEEFKELYLKCTELAFPSTVDGKKVLLLDEKTNYYLKNLKVIKLPEFVQNLWSGGLAYVYFPNAEKIILPKDLKIFANEQRQESVNIQNMVELLHIPSNVSVLHVFALTEFKNLKELVLSKNVHHIGNVWNDFEGRGKFFLYGCNSLEGIHIDGNNRNYFSIYGVIFAKDIYWNNYIDIGETSCALIRYPEAKKASAYIVPEGVEVISACAFSESRNLRKVVVSSEVKAIGGGAFNECTNLKEIILPDSIKVIGSEAFKKCINLKEIILPDNLEIIGKEAFAGCKKLTNVVIPEGVTELGAYCFANCPNLNTLTIPASVTKIGVRLVGLTYKDKITIITPKGSYAEQYAKKNGIPYKNK